MTTRGDVIDERILKYYLLCTTRNGIKRHIVTELHTRTRGNMITKKDFDTYLRPHGEYFAVRDFVVGGGSSGGSSGSSDVVSVNSDTLNTHNDELDITTIDKPITTIPKVTIYL